MRRYTSSRCQVSPGLGRRRRSLRAKSAPNLRHHCRMLSCVTPMPRSARISSTSRRLRPNTWMLLYESRCFRTAARRLRCGAEIAEDLPRDETLEAADDLRLVLPFGCSPPDVVDGGAVRPHPHDD